MYNTSNNLIKAHTKSQIQVTLNTSFSKLSYFKSVQKQTIITNKTLFVTIKNLDFTQILGLVVHIHQLVQP